MTKDYKVKDISKQILVEKKFSCRDRDAGSYGFTKEYKGKNL